MNVPYHPQDPQEVNHLVAALELNASSSTSRKKGGFSVKKTKFDVKRSRDSLTVDSWRMQDWDYKRPDLPTYARGLFTTRGRDGQHEIAIRGYDKFFNVGEVSNTKWDVITSHTQGPYELTLKENGCIIFISGMKDDTLLVCSKHSTGDRTDVNISHASAGERQLERQLQAIGKTRSDLARELYQRNATAVAELCDDDFEEHILAYGPDKAGLYLHGINLNLPQFTTYPSTLVQEFCDQWGFRKVGLMVMDDVKKVKSFLEEVAETGAHEGRDVEGFVIRCKMRDNAQSPYHDWFFKYKFEEPYLMYRQWRECTKALIANRPPKFKKHQSITEEYLLYARKRLAADPKLGVKYNQNHGIIALRDDFLKFKNLNGADAANIDGGLDATVQTEVTGDVILCPIATIGCGKTTLALALTHLFSWGHVQNDNISGKGRPPRFTKAVLGELKEHPAVFADRNNAQRHERRQLLTDVQHLHGTAKVVCLNFRHEENSIDEIRRVTQERVIARGDNHQTIHAATQKEKFLEVMEGFIGRYERCNPHAPPDDRFDLVINLDPTAGSRKNLEVTIEELQKVYPNLIEAVPTSSQLDEAIEKALGYQPGFKHTIASHSKKDRQQQQQQQAPQSKKPKKPQLEYIGINVSASHINAILEKAFQLEKTETARFFRQLQQTRRVQAKFHVTLMHRASSKQNPDLWQRYVTIYDSVAGEWSGQDLPAVGECQVQLERVVFDERIMAIVVRLIDDEGKWECVNQVAHITVGTRDDTVKPKESNDLLAKWLEDGTSTDRIQEVVFESKPVVDGTVKPVQSR